MRAVLNSLRIKFKNHILNYRPLKLLFLEFLETLHDELYFKHKKKKSTYMGIGSKILHENHVLSLFQELPKVIIFKSFRET